MKEFLSLNKLSSFKFISKGVADGEWTEDSVMSALIDGLLVIGERWGQIFITLICLIVLMFYRATVQIKSHDALKKKSSCDVCCFSSDCNRFKCDVQLIKK